MLEAGLLAERESQPPVTIRHIIGRNMTRLRMEADATFSDIVTAARYHGLTWTEAWVAGAERGQKALSAEHLLSLPLVLAAALKRRVALADLLIGDDNVALGRDALAVTATHLRDVVTATALRLGFGMPSTVETPEMIEAARAARRAERLRDIRRAGLGDVDIRVLGEADATAGEAEERLARRLGVPHAVIVAGSAILWGRSMTDEIATQLDAEATPYARARQAAAIARTLGAQLADRLAEAKARAAEMDRLNAARTRYGDPVIPGGYNR